MRLTIYIAAIAMIVTLSSCEKEIDFEYHDIPEQQVIEGVLTQEGVSVSLTRTIPTDEPFNNLTVTDATVGITDITDGQAYSLTANDNGIFTLEGFAGITGHKYELTVTVGNDTYTSTSRMLPKSEIVSAEFNWIKMPYDDVAILKVEFTEDEDLYTNYWLKVYRNGVIYDWQAIKSYNSVNGLVSGLMMTSRRDVDAEDDDEVLRDGDVIDIEVMPISQTMGDYLNSLNNGDYNGNRMFDGADCLGYFLAAPISKTQLIYHPDQIPYAD